MPVKSNLHGRAALSWRRKTWVLPRELCLVGQARRPLSGASARLPPLSFPPPPSGRALDPPPRGDASQQHELVNPSPNPPLAPSARLAVVLSEEEQDDRSPLASAELQSCDPPLLGNNGVHPARTARHTGGVTSALCAQPAEGKYHTHKREREREGTARRYSPLPARRYRSILALLLLHAVIAPKRSESGRGWGEGGAHVLARWRRRMGLVAASVFDGGFWSRWSEARGGPRLMGM